MRACIAHEAGVEFNPWSAARRAGLVAAFVILGSPTPQKANAVGETRTITLRHIHTKEDITITYKKNGRYDEEALKKLNTFVRDWRKDQEVRMDPQLYDFMWEVQHEVGHKGAIHIICGYRSPATNAMLRSRSRGVARTSLHMAGKAMDFSLPGADIAEVRAAALRLQGGGVGYYPSSGVAFVHMDVGNVRHWPRMTHDQLVRVFPKGRTLHVPSDGQPLPGYELAQADHERGMARRSSDRKSRTLLASLFNSTPDEDETSDATPAPSRQRSAASVRRQAPPAAETAETTQPVPLPQSRPTYQVASAESTPVRTLRPASAFTSSPAPNEVITDRGYWQGLPELNSAAARRVTEPRIASAGPEATGSIGPFAADDRLPSTVALAYAAQAEPPYTARGNVPAIVTAKPDATVAAKPVKPEPAASVRAVQAGERLDDPWMRGVIMAPRMQTSMTATVLGTIDFRSLRPFMQKPTSSVMMTFTTDPHLGMVAERFTGSAIVFQATVTHSMRTAALR